MSTMSYMTYGFRQPTVHPPSLAPRTGGHLTDQPEPIEPNVPFKHIPFHTAQCETESGPSPATFRRSFSREHSAILSAIDMLIRRLMDYQSPLKHEGALAHTDIEWPNLLVLADSALSGLEEVYVFEQRARVGEFVERHRLRNLLLQARDPLFAAFGETAVKRLSVLEDDEGCETLFCSIGISGSMNEARRALKSFDQSWWLAHCSKASGKLNFDLDLI
jgi:hypothetical protein